MSRRKQAQQWAFVRAVELYEGDADFDRTGAALVQARSDLDQLTALAVQHAVQRGRSWTDIGAALGVSRQAVQKKYGHLR